MPVKVGDVEMQMPQGMFLHKDFAKLRYHTVCKLTETNSYIQRKNQVIEQAELIREERKKLQTRLLDNTNKRAKRTTGLTVPKYIASTKNIVAEKKIQQKDLKLSSEGKVKY